MYPVTPPSGPEVVPPVIAPKDPLLTGEPLATREGDGSSGRRKKVILFSIVGLLLIGTIAGGIYLATHFAPKLTKTK